MYPPYKSDALKLSSDSDMQEWFLERDVKMPQVILHDKLISDALLGTLPIKTEHSYSLNSDGDSMPDSPGSLQAKMDDMDDECFPAISMSTATSNTRRLIEGNVQSALHTSSQNSSHSSSSSNSSTSSNQSTSHHRPSNKLQNCIDKMQQQQHQNTAICDNSSIESSDIDIDDSCIKDEPMSPSSSCPPSPVSPAYGISLNMANVAAFTNTDLVFEHKNGSFQLSPASQSLLKNQQIILSGTTNLQQQQQQQQQQRIVMPKLNIKMEQLQQSSVSSAHHIFNLPPTPPSSLPSDESEGNQSPERHLTSPMSPSNDHQQQQSSSSPVMTSTSARRPQHIAGSLSISNSPTSSSPGSHHSSSGRNIGYSGSSTRQPIHTPLISSQPKGSTGTLVLTEEEKRTLLAEGYPIPTRLPLTKAEEKSLKKIRRKIKNKISAQESRRKKKEYMDQLERKVELLVSENTDYRKRVESLEDSNANLMNQLGKLQALLSRQNSKKN